MKLRSFLYLDTVILDEYFAAINDGLYDEEKQAISSSDSTEIKGGIGIGNIGGSGEKNGSNTKEVERQVKNAYSSKFDKIYKYLKSDEDEKLYYYEFLDEINYNKISRDDYLEVPVKARFSKMKELTDSAKKLDDLVNLIEPLFGQEIIDEEAKEAIEGFNKIGKLNNGKGIACVFEFPTKKYPIVAYLNEDYFKCSQEQFLGEGYLFCKVIRKITKGEKVELDEIFDPIVKMASNREEQRKLKKNAKNPDEVRDVVKGPALMVLPIAFYH